jgi:hypothetical protein
MYHLSKQRQTHSPNHISTQGGQPRTSHQVIKIVDVRPEVGVAGLALAHAMRVIGVDRDARRGQVHEHWDSTIASTSMEESAAGVSHISARIAFTRAPGGAQLSMPLPLPCQPAAIVRNMRLENLN